MKAEHPHLPDSLSQTSVTARVWISLRRSKGGRFAGDTFRGIHAVIHGFRGERIALRAAALTYISIFSLVPLITVALVLIQALHQLEFQQRMLAFIHDIFAPVISAESNAFFERFITRASSVTAGGIGFGMLLISAGMLIKNLDASINEIWSVRKPRPLHIRVMYYAGILLAWPVLVSLSLVATAGLRAVLTTAHVPHVQQLFTAGTITVVVGAFTLLYYAAPNAPVRFRSALSGGLVAGFGWEAARTVYAAFGAQIFQYNPVYGSLGEAPLFLAWIYTSWMLVLFGARLAYAVEYASFQGTFRALGDHPRAKELIAAQMAQLITLAQVRGQLAPTTRELAQKLEVPEDTVREIAEQLELSGLVAVGRGGGLMPARSPDRLTVADLSEAVGGVIGLLVGVSDDRKKRKEFDHLEVLFAQIDRATVDRLGKVTWTSLIAPYVKTAAEPSPAQPARPKGKTVKRNP